MSQSPHGHDKIEDSLDNLSNLKLRQSSLQKHRVELIQVKQRFISLLQKLQTSQTREISIAQLKKLIQKHNESDHLRIYLAILKTIKPDHNSTTKQHEVLVISIIAKVFRSNLIDPVDKQPSLLKTCFKVVEICLGFFNDNSNTVQQACARVLLDLNEFCLEEGKYEKQQKLSIFFTPLVSILRNGVDKASQATATVCMNELIKFWYANQAKEYLDLVAKEVFLIILKINSQYHEIFMAAIILIEHKGLTFFENRLPNFISKILPIIDGSRDNTNSFNSYMCKVNVCKIIEKIAVLLSSQERQKLADLNIINSLTKAARNKIIQVQTAATRAIKVWKGESVSVEKSQKTSNSIRKPLRSLQEIRDQKKRQRSNSKQNTIKIQSELEYIKEDLEKMVKGGWGANNRAKQYVKRGSGVGGGHYGQVESTPPKSTKSHREHLEELRSLIKKGSKENKNIDKFSQFAEAGSRQNHQIPTNSNNSVNVFVQRNQRDFPSSPKSHQLPVNSNPKRNNFINEEHDFQVEDDEGDQHINFDPKPKENPQIKSLNVSSNNLVQKIERKNSQTSTQKAAQNFQIQADEARQFLENETSSAQSGSLQLNFKKEPTKSSFEKQKMKPEAKVKNEKLVKKASKIKQNLGNFGDLLSQEQLEQLMLENNLSEMSENVEQFLNASDLQMNEEKLLEKNLIANSVYEDSIQQRLDLPKTFTKKPAEKFDQSLNYTESQVSKFKQSIAKKDSQQFELSQSPPKTSGHLKQQFTLNPHNTNDYNPNKFQSIQESRNQEMDDEIEEDIVESCYEQSRPKEENLLPLKTKFNRSNQKPSTFKQPQKQPSNKFSLQKEEESQDISKNYQELIQNPPKLYEQPKHLDKKSFIKEQNPRYSQSQVNHDDEENGEYEEEGEKETVTDKWIRILSLVENNQINSAFEQAFLLDDPIYLIRLLIITRTPISSLTAENCTNLWSKFLNIQQHNFISILFVQLFTQANDLNLIKNSLTIEEIHELLVKLYEVSGTSKGKLSFNAALLYNKVDQSLKPKNKN